MTDQRWCHFVLLTFLCLHFYSCASDTFDSGSSSGSSSYTLWSCPAASVALSQALPEAFGNVTLLDQDGTNLVDAGFALYVRFLGGPADWESTDNELSYHFREYYVIGLTTGDVMYLDISHDYPFDSPTNAFDGNFYLLPPASGLSAEQIRAYVDDVSQSLYVNHDESYFLTSDATPSDTDNVKFNVETLADGVYRLTTTLDMHGLTGFDDAGFFDLAFDVRTSTQELTGGFQEATLIGDYTYDSTSSTSTYTVTVDGSVVATTTDGYELYSDARYLYDTYCGPGGGNIVNPVLLESDNDVLGGEGA